jgi:hypothetical protein
MSVAKTYNNPPCRPPLLNDLAFLISLLNRRPLVDPFFLLYAEQHGLAFVKKELCAIRIPHPDVLGVGERRILEQILIGNEDFRGEVEVDYYAFRV